jgi:hypothetical protein
MAFDIPSALAADLAGVILWAPRFVHVDCGVNHTMNVFSVSVFRLGTCLTLGAIAAVAGTTPISIALSSSPNPSTVGQVVTLTAGVSPEPVGNVSRKRVSPDCAGICAPTGVMTFYDGNTVLGTATGTDFPVFGSFTLVANQLASGPHTLSASYAGDSYYAAATSSPLVQTVLALQITTPSPLPNGLVGSPYLVTLATNAVAGSYQPVSKVKNM